MGVCGSKQEYDSGYLSLHEDYCETNIKRQWRILLEDTYLDAITMTLESEIS